MAMAWKKKDEEGMVSLRDTRLKYFETECIDESTWLLMENDDDIFYHISNYLILT